MKYKFNGVEIDSQRGSPALGIPAGTQIPVQPGDILQYGVNNLTFKRAGLYSLEHSTLVTQRSESLTSGVKNFSVGCGPKGNA